MRLFHRVVWCLVAVLGAGTGACDGARNVPVGGGGGSAETSADAVRRAQDALLESVDWETAAIFKLSIDPAAGNAEAWRIDLGDEPAGLSLEPLYDWMATLGASPKEIYLKVHGAASGAAACGLPGTPEFVNPEVACVTVSVVNQTGLDLPTFLLEAFWLESEPLPRYHSPLANLVARDDVAGELIGGVSDDPGPLWLSPSGGEATLAFPFGSVPHAIGLRVMVQREVCGNGKDDDFDGRVDEACGATEDGGECLIDLDCANASCTAGLCQEPVQRWRTLGVYALSEDVLIAARNGAVELESLAIAEWPEDFVPAADKAVHATRLRINSTGLNVEECDLVAAWPYTDGVACPSLSVGSTESVASRHRVMIEFLSEGGGPAMYGDLHQREMTFGWLPPGDEGRGPDAGRTFRPMVPGVIGEGDWGGAQDGWPPAPGGVNDPGPWGGPTGTGLETMPWEPGDDICPPIPWPFEIERDPLVRLIIPDLDFFDPDFAPDDDDNDDDDNNKLDPLPAMCAELSDETFASSEPAAPGLPTGLPVFGGWGHCTGSSSSPGVYNIERDFEQMLREIAWSPEFLTHEFVAQAYGEEDAFTYMRQQWGDDRLEEVFPGFEQFYATNHVLAYLHLATASYAEWAELLRPVADSSSDAYWGLRVLAEHGSLGNRELERVRRPTTYESLEERHPTSGEPVYARFNVYDARPIGPLIESSREYVLAPGRYVVRTGRSIGALWPYHGPMTDYCSAQITDPNATGGPQDYAESFPPDRRYGWPALTFYGWSDVTLFGCGASIAFEPSAIGARSTNPFSHPPAEFAGEQGAWIPICLSHKSREKQVRFVAAYGPQALRILGSDNVTITGVNLVSDLERLVTRYDGVNGVYTYDGDRGFNVSPLEMWDDISPYYAAGGVGSLDPDHAPPLCSARNDQEPLGSLLTVVRENNLSGFGPALEVSDSHGIYLRNVSARGVADGLLLGGNDVEPLCHQSDSGTLRNDSDGVSRLLTPLADQKRPTVFAASTEVLNRQALAHRENLRGSERWPVARFGVVGLCDALPCPVLNFRLSGGEFEGTGRNSLTIGHARRGVVRGTHITNAGTALRNRPLFYSSPALGLDLEPSEGNQAVRLSDSYGRRARLVSGDVNFVNNSITENFGGALSLNSKIGISESVTFLENTFVTANRDLTGRFKDFLNTSTWNADFVCNRFVLGNGRNMRLWLDGGSGVFMGNRVAGTGDITFGGNATGCAGELGVSSQPANFPTNEQQCDNMVGGTTDAFGASGPSPYARCEDVAYCGWQNSDIERPPVVRDPSVPDDPLTEDVDESLYIGVTDILSPRTDVPWIVEPTGANGQPLPLDHTLFRIVSNNYFVMSPQQQSATEWEGDSILGFVDRFENNTVCMRAPDAGTTSMSLELRAPMIDGSGHNTQFVANFEGEECVTTGVEIVVPTDVSIPEFAAGECSDAMRRFLACNCGQKDSVPLTATEVDIAGSRNAALEALCTHPESGEVATSTWLQFEDSVSPFLSTAEYVSDSLDACVAPWEPRATLTCWEDVEEMRWRSLVPEQELNNARDRWRGVARSSALWGFPASRYPSLDSAETSVLRTWVDRVEEQGE